MVLKNVLKVIPLQSRTVQLADGRQLGYARYGSATGRPVLYFHGLPGSRYESRLLHTRAEHLDIQVVAPDRPGYGLSTRQRDRRLLHWPDDVAALADALDIETFSVIGVSGGGPCALACARMLGQRVVSAAVVGGLGPVDQAPLRRSMPWPARFAFQLAALSPGALAACYGLPVTVLARLAPAIALRVLAATVGKADRQVLLQPQVLTLLADNLREAFRQGWRGALQDVAVYRHPWGFALPDIAPPVHFWHGDADRIVPLQHSEYLHEALPRSRLTVVPGEGHFSLPVRHAATILESLLAEAATGPRPVTLS